MGSFNDDPYRELLGLRPFINASGNSTTLGGSVMPGEVVEAMAAAARSFIDLNALHERAGEKLAEMIGVEAAFISCGASSGVAMCAAACMTGGDPERVAGLPHTDAFPDEFVISLIDPHVFVHQGIESVGGKLVKVGSRTDAGNADMVAAIGPRTAAVVLFYGLQSKQDLAELASAASERGVPVIVDAAAQLPPRSNLTSLLDLGASLVVFSGGKAIRGPQSTGLVLGRADLVQAVRLNANPFTAIGRGMKVGKEEIVGLLAAVELFLSTDEEEELARWRQDLEGIAAVLNAIDGIHAEVGSKGHAAAPAAVARGYVTFDPDRTPAAASIIDELLAGEPSIALRADGDAIVIDPMTMLPGDAEVVARRMAEVVVGG
ncbi:MAG: selenocysteine synthase [bacterium]|nr:selenocysteine synthase [bacterium]MDE0287839.1 selenocysteine synthase [bacterium]MDE0438330.1 selenocysteine synthase [bacterium]